MILTKCCHNGNLLTNKKQSITKKQSQKITKKRMTSFTVLRIKDIRNLTGLSEGTCKKIYKDIKITYCLKYVTYYHFSKYLKVS